MMWLQDEISQPNTLPLYFESTLLLHLSTLCSSSFLFFLYLLLTSFPQLYIGLTAKPDFIFSTRCKKMFKMDFSLSFPLTFMLVILTILDAQTCTGMIRIAGDIGSTISVPLKILNTTDFSVTKDCPHLINVSTDCCSDYEKRMCLSNGTLEMKNLTDKDEGRYTLAVGNESKTLLLRVCEPPLVVRIHCLSDGRADVSCEVGGHPNDSVHWTLNGRKMNDTEVCQKDGGKRIILEKGTHGKLVCYRSNACNSSSIELSCNDGNEGDLLQHPLFLYILAACGGGALLLAILASLITCCCMKSMHHFVPVPAEDEKDEGITLSAISSEGPKSPPNGEHCEATGALPASIPNPDSETCGSSKQQPKMDLNPTAGSEGKSETKTEEKTGTETEFREVMVDTAALELVDDCFSDPVDA
ncbi:uncharacterized protein LOC110088432 [Pogona vitticeps]